MIIFQDYVMEFFAFNVVVEISCMIQIFLNSHMSYIDMRGDEILDPGDIWKHYLKGKLIFIFFTFLSKNENCFNLQVIMF